MKELSITWVDYVGIGAVLMVTAILLALWWLN